MKPPSLIGMVHLLPLPGSPRFGGDMETVVAAALGDAEALVDSGFPGLMVENFGDAPFYPMEVPPVTVAAITKVVVEISRFDVPVGVNVLRNDAASALAIAAATGADFVRVNVLTGTMFTDQGPIVGRAAEVARLRSVIAPHVAILADVFVKHASPPAGLTIEQAGRDTWERGGADLLVVSGEGTGVEVDFDLATRLHRAVPDAPILIGSGATADNLEKLAAVASGAIVGSSLKETITAPVDRVRARALVEAAREVGWL